MAKRKTAEDRYRTTRSELDELQRWFLDQYVSLGQASALVAQGHDKAAAEIFDNAEDVLKVVNYALSDGYEAILKKLKKSP